MEFIISTGFRDYDFKLWVWKKLKSSFEEQLGLCYEGYLISSGSRNKSIIDILMLHSEMGYAVIEIVDWSADTRQEIIKETLDNLLSKYYDINMRFKREKSLRVGKSEKYQGVPILIIPTLTKSQWGKLSIETDEITVLCADGLQEDEIYKSITSSFSECNTNLNVEEWQNVLAIVQGGQVMQATEREDSTKPSTKKSILKKLEANMSLLDLEQEKVARQIPNGPQRIRGLAGSGKTIVMTMKAALMHIANPDWDILYVFSTQSLYNIIKDYIERFTLHFANVKPNWNKLRVLHGWGSQSQEGLYSFMCKQYNIKPISLKDAKKIFGNSDLLGNLCLKLTNEVNIEPRFDAILMDEAQDFEFGFYRFCHHILMEPKRLIWAYDEVQSLSNLTIPTAQQIFGVNEYGDPLVSLEGSYSDGIEKDFILYHCYRNPRPVLVAAHFFGMGLFKEQGAVQFIPTQGGWEDIGYELVSGEFKIGEEITMRRPFENSPNNIEKLIGYENVLKMRVFSEFSSEIIWVANEIHRNLTEDELSPNDILIIGVDNQNYTSYGNTIKGQLAQFGIDMIIAGDDTASNVFRIENKVTFSGIRRAKGNEASIVYILGFDSILSGYDIVQLRNTAFTAMTRSKGWCTITGVGQKAEILFNEIKQIAKNPEQITFKVPDPKSIERLLDNIEYEKRRTKIREATKIINKLDKILNEDDIKYLSPESVNRLLAKLRGKEKRES